MIVILAAILGGWSSRNCGGGWPKMPLALEQWIYGIPYGAAMAINPISAVIAYLCAVLGKRMGHGQYIHLGKKRQVITQDEVIDPLLRFFFGVDRGGAYWRCVCGLAITGLAVTVPTGVLYGGKGGAMIAISGASKGMAYMIGHSLPVKSPTIIGEILTGVFGWGILAAVYNG